MMAIAQDPAAAPPAKGHSRARSVAVVVLLVLAPIVFFVGALATWVDRTALENATWADVTEQIVQDPAVSVPLSAALAQRVQERADFQQRLNAALPPNLQPLAAPAAGALNELVQRAAVRIVESPRGVELMVKASRVAQAQSIAIIDGDTPLGDVEDGVTISTSDLLAELSQQLGLPDAVANLPVADKQIVIVPNENLSTIRNIVSWLRALSTWTIFVGLALFAAAIWLAGDRRRAVFWSAMSLIGVALLLVITKIAVGGILPGEVAVTESGQQAATAIWNIVSAGLVDISKTMAAVGIIGVAGAWLVGPSPRATRARGFVGPLIENAWYAFGGLAAVLLLLIAWGPTRGTRTPVTIAIVTVLAVIGLEVLRRQTADEGRALPAADPTF
jgi:hypothetical protein